MSIHEEIALLRGLLNQQKREHTWREELYSLLNNAYQLNEADYVSILLPYLQSFDELWSQPFAICHSFESLDSWVRLIPFAAFELNLRMKHSLPEDIHTLTVSQALQNVEILNVNSTIVKDEQAIAILGSEYLVNLDTLYVEARNMISSQLVRLLTRQAHFQQIRHLYMGANWIGASAWSFGHSTDMSRLETWRLDVNNLGTNGVKTIFENGRFPSLKSLHLRQNKIDDEGVACLANTEYLSSLERLSLGRNSLSSDGVRHLADSPYLRQLRVLELMENPEIDDEAAYMIANSHNFQNLQELYLGENQISDEGWLMLIQSENLSQAVRLQLASKVPLERFQQEARHHGVDVPPEMHQRDILQAIWERQAS